MSVFKLIDMEKASYSVTILCRMLEVSKSGYYACRSRPFSKRICEDDSFTEKIREIHIRSRDTENRKISNILATVVVHPSAMSC